ncbi:hypothetical protein PQR14_22110 [Paraburkholderia bryophila]
MDSVNEASQTMHCAIEAFERRMTLRIYAVGVGVVAAATLLQHFWT